VYHNQRIEELQSDMAECDGRETDLRGESDSHRSDVDTQLKSRN